MSLKVDVLSTDSRFETIILMLLVVVFSILSVGLIILFLNLNGYTISTSDLLKIGFLEILIKNPGDSLLNWRFNEKSLGLILFWSTPLALAALSVAIAFHAGLFNIGGQGQMMVGGAFAGIWAAVLAPDMIANHSSLSWLDNPIFMILSTIIAGMIGGGIWGFIPGVLKAYTGAHEVITTILMNLIAITYVTYLVGNQSYSPYIDDASSGGDQRGQTPIIMKSAQLNQIDFRVKFFGNELFHVNPSRFLNWSFIFAIIIIILMWFIIYKTTFGFELRAVGFNKTAAQTSGVHAKRMTIYAMTLAGILAGVGGALLTMSPLTAFRFKISSIGTTGFDGIAISLIGLNNPIGVGFAALFFGFLTESRSVIDVKTDIPADLIFVFQSFIILFSATPLIGKRVLKRFREVQNLSQQNIVDDETNQTIDKTKMEKKGE